jgi:hypothetical protein
MITHNQIKIVAEIAITADRIESSKTVGKEFQETVMQYLAGINVTEEELEQIMDTKLREIIGRA